MRLDAHFVKLIENISLDTTRKKRIESAYATLTKLMKEDEEISTRFIRVFPQGSYITGTLVRPVLNKEYDIDIVLALNLKAETGKLYDPAVVIDWLAKRIVNADGTYKDKAKPKNRCVRIVYANDFRLDITPVHQEGVILYAPNKEQGWSATNPEGYAAWCNEINQRSDKMFQNIVQMLKRWRDLNFSKETMPKSIMFTRLIGDFMSFGSSSMADTLVSTMRKMNAYFQMQQNVPKVENPSLREEDLSRDWTQENYELFKKKFKTATATAELALTDATQNTSIEKWKQIFKDAFPESLGIAAPIAGLSSLAATFPNKAITPNKPAGFA